DLPIEYSMLRWGGRWMVRDVVIEGVSLIANYRAQFIRVIRASSYAGLIARMRGDGDESSPRERKFVVTVETVPVPPVPVSAVPIGRAPVGPIQTVDPIPAAPPLTASRVPSVEPAPLTPPPAHARAGRGPMPRRPLCEPCRRPVEASRARHARLHALHRRSPQLGSPSSCADTCDAGRRPRSWAAGHARGPGGRGPTILFGTSRASGDREAARARKARRRVVRERAREDPSRR